jgi:medium-chain acyl-[acyl-carrier-protein] hydrolase
LLLPEIELYLVHLPGRDKRIREPFCVQFRPLIESLTDALHPHLNKPFAFFGHSMGALLSFEVVRQLRRQYGIQPVHLFVSGRHAPQLPDSHPEIPYLPEPEFRSRTEQLYGALPEVILQDRELLQLFLSMMRADLTMLATYRYQQEHSLDCPISVFGGLQDNSITKQELAAWEDQTAAGFKLTMLPGEHLFIQSAQSDLLQALNNEIAQLLAVRS